MARARTSSELITAWDRPTPRVRMARRLRLLPGEITYVDVRFSPTEAARRSCSALWLRGAACRPSGTPWPRGRGLHPGPRHVVGRAAAILARPCARLASSASWPRRRMRNTPTAADETALARKLAVVLDSGAAARRAGRSWTKACTSWWVPGSGEIEQAQLHAADKPRRGLREDRDDAVVAVQHYAGEAAKDLRYALAHLDVDPAPRRCGVSGRLHRSADVRAPRATLAGPCSERHGGGQGHVRDPRR